MPASLSLSHLNPVSRPQREHNEAVIGPLGVERAIVGLCNGLAEYCQSRKRLYGRVDVSDQTCGGAGVLEVLRGARTLLKGPVGRLDRERINDVLCLLAASHGITI